MIRELIGSYWPNHPSVLIVGYDVEPPAHEGTRFVSVGSQDMVSWTDGLLEGLGSTGKRLALVMLDDYGLCLPVKFDLMLNVQQRMDSDGSNISCTHLTWQPTAAKVNRKGGYCDFTPWPYLINTQACLWSVEALKSTLGKLPGRSVEAFELEGSRLALDLFVKGVDIADPSNPSGFVDSTDKAGWVMPYHNLMRRCKPDARHNEFLRNHGL
jgi:hypothetical protein